MNDVKMDYPKALRDWTLTNSRELPIEEICETLDAYDKLKSTLTHYESALKEARCCLSAVVHGPEMAWNAWLSNRNATIDIINKALEGHP